MMLLSRREKSNFKVAAIHPPEYGHWRKAMLEDIAITTGGRVISRDLGGTRGAGQLEDLGSARQVRISSIQDLDHRGPWRAPGDRGATRAGIPAIRGCAGKYRARQVSGTSRQTVGRHGDDPRGRGHAGGAEAARATDRGFDQRHARGDRGGRRARGRRGADPGRVRNSTPLIKRLTGCAKQGAELVQRSLSQPLACIVANCGRDSAEAVAKVARAGNGHGFDARTGATVDMVKAGIVDPVKVSYCAVRNAGSVAALILTTQTLIAKKPDDYDPTAGRPWAAARSGFDPARSRGTSLKPGRPQPGTMSRDDTAPSLAPRVTAAALVPSAR